MQDKDEQPEEANQGRRWSDQDTGGEAERRRKQRLRAGMAFGIGSAAITAALLYANRPRGKGKDKL